MINNQYHINGGIYLVLNPAMDTELLLTKLASALNGGLQVVQIWNNWPSEAPRLAIIEAIGKLCEAHKVPLLINQEWELLQQSHWLQGVHFDDVPEDLETIRQSIGRPFLTGITCSGDLEKVRLADEKQVDYISFCSMFPSTSASHCDLVMPAIVRAAKQMTSLPIFVAGGVTPENMISLKQATPFDGVAVISGILSAANPQQQVKSYRAALSSLENVSL